MRNPSPKAVSADKPSATLVQATIKDIVVHDRLRRVLPDRVATLQVSFAKRGQMVPVDLVEGEAGARLIFGAHRIAARLADGHATVMALLHPKGAFGSEAEIRHREIAENFDRFELTVLEKAANVAEMRELHEAEFGPAKRGRKPKAPSNEEIDEMSAKLALNFPEVVQRTLGLSRREVFRHLKVATIDAVVRDSLAAHAIANNQSELLALAAETPARRALVAGLLLAADTAELSVAEAIARIDGLPAPRAMQPHERVAESFSRLKADQQDQFFDLHADAIQRWQLTRRARKH